MSVRAQTVGFELVLSVLGCFNLISSLSVIKFQFDFMSQCYQRRFGEFRATVAFSIAAAWQLFNY